MKHGSMLRQVRGPGSLIPAQDSVRQIPAETEATVVRIRMLPGSQVKADTILLEMSNPQTEQSAVDAQLQLKAAVAEYQSLRVKLESELMNQKAGSAATVSADHAQAHRQAETDKALYDLGVISGLAYKSSKEKADELTTRNDLEGQRLSSNEKAIDSQMAQQQAKSRSDAHACASSSKNSWMRSKCGAGIDGVLVDLPLQVGQHVSPGTMLAKVVRARSPDGDAEDCRNASSATCRSVSLPSIDTHNGVVAGTVMRVDPAVQNGTVTVDVKLTGELPKGARPDLSVDGTIDLERLDNILYVGRPAVGQESSTISLFKLSADGMGASRVPVKVGRASVNSIQVMDGLKGATRSFCRTCRAGTPTNEFGLISQARGDR